MKNMGVMGASPAKTKLPSLCLMKNMREQSEQSEPPARTVLPAVPPPKNMREQSEQCWCRKPNSPEILRPCFAVYPRKTKIGDNKELRPGVYFHGLHQSKGSEEATPVDQCVNTG